MYKFLDVRFSLRKSLAVKLTSQKFSFMRGVDDVLNLNIARNETVNSNVLVMVMSYRYHFDQRRAIRKTWSKGYHNVVFLVGNSSCLIPIEFRQEYICEVKDNDTNDLVLLSQAKYAEYDQELTWLLYREMEEYRDVVILPFTDTYKNLTLKLKYGYAWVVKNTKAAWILKVDDDTVVFMNNLLHLVHETANTDPGFVIIGSIQHEAKVFRDGKWQELNYKPSFYPPFPIGSAGHLVSRGIAEYVANNKDKLHDYQGEDVSLGIWISEAPFSSMVKWITSPLFTNKGNCNLKHFVVVGHSINSLNMKTCF
jgi:hypothetical protein